MLANRLLLLYGVPYAVCLQGSDVPGCQADRFGYVYPFVRPIFRRGCRSAQSTVAAGADLRCLSLKSAPVSDIHVVPNGVDTEPFHPREPATEGPGSASTSRRRDGAIDSAKGNSTPA